MELVRIGRHIACFQAVVFKAFIADATSPDKNEDYAQHKKDVRHIGLFKGQLEHLLLRTMIIRGGKLHPWILKPVNDPLDSPADLARAATLEARFAALGVRESERRRLVPCAVLKARWPETVFSPEIEKRLLALRAE